MIKNLLSRALVWLPLVAITAVVLAGYFAIKALFVGEHVSASTWEEGLYVGTGILFLLCVGGDFKGGALPRGLFGLGVAVALILSPYAEGPARVIAMVTLGAGIVWVLRRRIPGLRRT